MSYKVLVLGADGMLGTYMYEHLKRSGDINVWGSSRAMLDLSRVEEVSSCLKHLRGFKNVVKFDLVVNCAGIVNTRLDEVGLVNSIKVNSIVPHLFSEACSLWEIPFIHITTDCVFDGKNGYYTESSPHNATDWYGRTKSLGEPSNCTVLRTSIIGESKKGRSLIEWIKSQRGKEVKGFTNHFWNGVTCLQLSKCVEYILRNNLYFTGVRHVYSPKDYTKKFLVDLVNEELDLGIEVVQFETPKSVDRTLRTDYPKFLNQLDIPDIRHQLKEMFSEG